MRKFKITLLVFYVLIVVILIYEAAIPGDISSKQHNFIKKIINNISKIFIKEKIINANEIVVKNSFKDNYYTNETLTLDLEVLPNKASYKTLTFTSSNTNILEVSSGGVVTFKSEGTANITIKQVESNIEKTITLNVLEYIPPIDELIEPNVIYLRSIDNKTTTPVGDVIRFTLDYDNPNVNDLHYYLTSSNEEVCKCFDDYIYGLSEGVATITATHKTTGLTSTMDIEITSGTIVKPTYFRIVGSDTYYVNDKSYHKFSLDIDPNASNMYKEVRFISYDKNYEHSDLEILNVGWNTGELVYDNYGIGYVYVVCCNWEFYDSIKVTVKNILPQFELKDQRMVLGDSYKVKINPTNKDSLTYKKYEFKSSDEAIATIDGLGNVLAKKTGEATITVVVDDGIDKVEKSFILTIDNKVIEDDIGSSFGKIIRKGIAHFLGFIVFGFVSFFMFYLFIKANYSGSNKLSLLVIAINGLVFAVLTEVIQLASPGRDGTIRDVLLDYFGYTISFIVSLGVILLCYFISSKRKNKEKNNDNIKNDEII